MSEIMVPTLEARCLDYKTIEMLDNDKTSNENLDFTITFLNLPTATNMDEDDENRTENEGNLLFSDSSPYTMSENCPSSSETITTTTDTSAPQNLQIKVLCDNSNNNHENYSNIMETNDIMPRQSIQTTDETTCTTTTPATTTIPLTKITRGFDYTKNNDKEIPVADNNEDPTFAVANNEVIVNESKSLEHNHEDYDENGEEEEEEEEEYEEEDELTNLTWLTELRNQSITWPSSINPTILDDNPMDSSLGSTRNASVFEALNANKSEEKGSRGIRNGNSKNYNAAIPSGKVLNGVSQPKIQSASNAAKNGGASQSQVKRPTPAERYQTFMDKVKRDLEEYEQSAANYQADPTEKPPFNYSHIIGMAMLEKGRVTLQQICSWIESKFAFFRVRKKWNNSIRHNLSLHPCFRKISRNKQEKGKGGYWELGVDPKKCDRKRIRNRKSANSTHKNKKNNSHTKISDSNSSPDLPEALPTLTTTTPHLTSDMEMELDVQLPVGLMQTEQLLLDDLDVQQNIDISNHEQQLQSHQLQEEEAFIANVLANCIGLDGVGTHDVATDGICSSNSSGGGIELPPVTTMTLTSSTVPPQYQLGTVIISTSADDIGNMDMATTLNSFVYSNNDGSMELCQPPLQHKVLYREDEIPSACENIIVSSFLNDSMDPQSSQVSIPNQPKVIVEPIQPYYSAISASATALVSNPSGDHGTSNVSGDHFRPYIDGIDEAFQYLRSMDNNRSEDLLDNLLDISVSDY